jgi:hypothetical protein
LARESSALRPSFQLVFRSSKVVALSACPA